ncbi:glycine--tRNA ligase [Candidatus Pacearchaeota archaeon CG10_big_fil_rev_8_21_14_0_10_32_14]|nr:MAG: glycine--tRNA ligase [Candidatus Pacearchaeota archaeon CG10_big_fil_rev_8_21_14_0_10_32_14]
MPFIVKKKINGKEYFYLQESRREGDKVKSVTLGYLGKTKKEAEKRMKSIMDNKATEKMEKKVTSENNEAKNEKKMERKIEKIDTQMKVKKTEYERIPITVDELSNFCKRKGFVFRSSDIYGGYAGFWDFGPLGVELFNNIKQDWWNYFVKGKDNMVGMEASVISHPRVWKASGHVDNFSDIMIYDKKSKKQIRADQLIEQILKINVEGKDKNEILNIIKGNKKKFHDAGYDLEEEITDFNLMFKTNVGPKSGENESIAYLRGETAQGMFSDFKLIMQTGRQTLPFGVAQIGRCFRNEIAPRDFLFRSREFHIGEFEFFINPNEIKCNLLTNEHLDTKFKILDEETQKKGSSELKEISLKEMLEAKKLDEWHAYWLVEQIMWMRSINLTEIKIREHTKDELSHYSSATFDIDFEFPFGSKEIAGNANRGQYDLMQHQKESKEKMEIFDEKYNEKVVPRVIEPTFGMERIFLAILTKAYSHDREKDTVVLRLPAKLAPIKAAIFPIIKEEKFEAICESIVNDLRKEFYVVYDKSGSIGRRYARNDEIGTPYCITIDENSLKNKDVTIRERDSTKQIRVMVKDLRKILGELIREEIKFTGAGKVVETRVK